jgi:hypothetical protein
MFSSTPRQSLRALLLTMLVVFLVNPFVMFLPQRGMDGGGYYFFVSHITFYKLFLTTFLACLWVLRRRRKHHLLTCLTGAVAGTMINIGTLIIDVRSHSYLEFPELYILENFGSPEVVMLKGFGLLFGGIALLWKGFVPLVQKEDKFIPNIPL